MIALAPFTQPDFKQLIEWINTKEILTNWSGHLFRFPLTQQSLAWYVEGTNIKNDSEAFVYKAINGAGKTVGHVSLGSISWKNRSVRITRVLIGDTTERGKGCCQGMIKAALKIAFEELGFHRVCLGVYDDNVSAIRCYEKAGFITEGIQRDILWYHDAWWSMREMSILENEWRALNLVDA